MEPKRMYILERTHPANKHSNRSAIRYCAFPPSCFRRVVEPPILIFFFLRLRSIPDATREEYNLTPENLVRRSLELALLGPNERVCFIPRLWRFRFRLFLERDLGVFNLSTLNDVSDKVTIFCSNLLWGLSSRFDNRIILDFNLGNFSIIRHMSRKLFCKLCESYFPPCF